MAKSLQPTALKKQLSERSGKRRRARTEAVAVRGHVAAVRNDLLPELKINYLPITTLKSARRQVRKPTPEQLTRIVASVSAFGLLPIIIDRDAHVIDGHLVVEAARQLGLDRVPCIRMEHLSDEEVRLLTITLNRLQERGEWDIDALAIEFRELELDFDLTLTGFSLPEVDAIMVMADEAEDGEEQVPEPEALAVSRPGDSTLR